ncbi:MAG: helix-turn-helix domain-containing protein [Candidatus Omnitrophica bacterium]|nr:helix-turn-helix domain-containing protein [Candidatus Omnitrophota bacterium]
MAKYQRLKFTEREEISREIAAGKSLREVAKTLRRSSSTITREINRSVVDRKFYRAFFAQVPLWMDMSIVAHSFHLS